MTPTPIFSGVLINEVKLHMQKDKYKKYYTHIKQVKLNF